MISGNERVPFVMLDFVPQQRLKKFSVYTPGIMVPNLIHFFAVGQIGGRRKHFIFSASKSRRVIRGPFHVDFARGGGGGIMNPRAAEGWGTERRGEGKGGRPLQQAAQGDSETDEQARKRDSESP